MRCVLACLSPSWKRTRNTSTLSQTPYSLSHFIIATSLLIRRPGLSAASVCWLRYPSTSTAGLTGCLQSTVTQAAARPLCWQWQHTDGQTDGRTSKTRNAAYKTALLAMAAARAAKMSSKPYVVVRFLGTSMTSSRSGWSLLEGLVFRRWWYVCSVHRG